MKKDTLFGRFARCAATAAGSPPAFAAALLGLVVWLVLGPVFGFSDTWQLVINTSTSLITFLMVFIIQHSQNKDTLALQLKLDELIHRTKGADDRLLDLEELSDDELDRVHHTYIDQAAKARSAKEARKKKR